MEQLDSIREKLDIKILLLFILRRLPSAVSTEPLSEWVTESAGVGYFEFAECLTELVERELVKRETVNKIDMYQITEAGDRNGEIAEVSLPYSVRARVSEHMRPLATELRRRAQITAKHTTEKTGCRVELALRDGIGEVMGLKLLCADEAQAKRMEQCFIDEAENIYLRIVEMLDSDTAAQAEKSRQNGEED